MNSDPVNNSHVYITAFVWLELARFCNIPQIRMYEYAIWWVVLRWLMIREPYRSCNYLDRLIHFAQLGLSWTQAIDWTEPRLRTPWTRSLRFSLSFCCTLINTQSSFLNWSEETRSVNPASKTGLNPCQSEQNMKITKPLWANLTNPLNWDLFRLHKFNFI